MDLIHPLPSRSAHTLGNSQLATNDLFTEVKDSRHKIEPPEELK
jgi:hypothetical protein